MREALLRGWLPMIVLLVACGARQSGADDPLATVRRLAESALECEVVTVREIDPRGIPSGRLPPYVAIGCEHYAYFACEPGSSAAGSTCAMSGPIHDCDVRRERQRNEGLLKKDDVDAATPWDFEEGPCFEPAP